MNSIFQESTESINRRLTEQNQKLLQKLNQAEKQFQNSLKAQKQMKSIPLKRDNNSFMTQTGRKTDTSILNNSRPPHRSESNPVIKEGLSFDTSVHQQENLKQLEALLPPPKLPKSKTPISNEGLDNSGRVIKMAPTENDSSTENLREKQHSSGYLSIKELNVQLHENIVRSLQCEIQRQQEYFEKYRRLISNLDRVRKEGRISQSLYNELLK